MGASFASWDDPAHAGAWSAQWSVLLPIRLPLGTVSTAWTSTATGGTFGLVVPNGTNTVPVDVSDVSGSATLVFQVDTTNGIVLTPRNIADPTVLATVSAALQSPTQVKVFGVPEVGGHIKAYVLLYGT